MELAGAGALLLLSLFFTILFSSFKMYKKKSQLPPGPTPWLFLGNLLQKDVLPVYNFYKKLVDKYGPIFTVWIGPKPIVVICGYETMIDAFVNHAEEFGGRPAMPFMERVSKYHGPFTRNEAKWRELHRFTFSTLREFGMGKRTMSERIQEEALCLVEELVATQGQAFDPRRSFTCAVKNVICSVVFGNRFDYKDQVLLENLRIMQDLMSYLRSLSMQIYNVFPGIMAYLPGQHRKVLADCGKMQAFIRERVESHRRTLDPQNLRDYIDCFLIRSEKKQTDPEDIYSTEELVQCVFGLCIAGTLNCSDALVFSLMVMAKFPHIQAKVQREIDEVVGANRIPGMDDWVRLPYTNAVIHETQRFEKVSLEGFPRATTCRTEFWGYIIPQSTTVVPMLTTVHYDPLQWETPEKFNPGHFLDEKGQFRKRYAFMPFSAGKRACPGEALARMELFLFFSVLLQNFTFQLVGEFKEKDVKSFHIQYKMKSACLQMQAIRRSK
ncbi:cytochrome P450 2B4-like [Lacerta agilis]|uniref:cytochrome P450 2B4-like n=1 Tax=Lacerta agilis TaxID=80427 RepID=UPI001419D763|nr:cytochrome P450 2B4-like [Lacerta agilis]